MFLVEHYSSVRESPLKVLGKLRLHSIVGEVDHSKTRQLVGVQHQDPTALVTVCAYYTDLCPKELESSVDLRIIESTN